MDDKIYLKKRKLNEKKNTHTRKKIFFNKKYIPCN